MSRVLFENDDFRVTLRETGSDLVVVGFSPMHWPGMRRRGSHWGDSVARKAPYSWLAIDALREHWFAHSKWRNVAGVVREAAQRYAIRVGFGHSMGAYAALRHSVDYEPRSILAFAPQWSIDPQEVRVFDSRYERHFDPRVHSGMSLQEQHVRGNAVVFYDPHFGPDREHALRIGATRLPVPHMRHDVIDAAIGSTALTYLVMRALGGSPSDHLEMTRFVNTQKKQTPVYLTDLSNRTLKRNRPALAEILSARAVKLEPTNSRAKLLGIQACIKQGLVDEARKRLANLDIATLTSTETMSVARCMVDVGLAARAMDLMNAAGVLADTNITHLRTLADVCVAHARPTQAIEALERAVALEPTNPHCLAHLGRVLVKSRASSETALARAIPLFDMATKLAPKVPTFWKSLAFAHELAGDAVASLAAWEGVTAVARLSDEDKHRIERLKARIVDASQEPLPATHT